MPAPQNKPNHPHFDKIGIVARWRPVHLGHQAVLNALCQNAKHVLIGIGSSNVYNYRSPFTLAETTEMLQLALAGWENYTLIPVPDLNDGPRWQQMVQELFGPLDLFLTDNPYVASLMRPVYPVERPVALVPEDQRVAISGTMVRREMARGGEWHTMVSDSVAAYLKENNFVQRFKHEFGLQTLAIDSMIQERSN